MDDKDCFLCQCPDCSQKCPKEDCKTYFCSEIHYAPHIFHPKSEVSDSDKLNIRHLPDQNTESDNAPSIIETKATDDGLKTKTHETSICLPYKVCKSEIFGRYFVATRDIEPLELILSDEPAVIIPTRQENSGCIQCLRQVENDTR